MDISVIIERIIAACDLVLFARTSKYSDSNRAIHKLLILMLVFGKM